MAALRPRSRIDRAIDQGRFPRSQGIGERLREPLRIEGVVTDAAKSFDQLFITRLLHQDGRSGVGATSAVNVVATVNSTVVEDDSDDGQLIAANCFDLHSAEAERAVAFDGHYRLAADDCRADCVAHADAHHPPRPAIKAFTRFAHVDNVSGNVERVGSLVYEIDLRLVGEHAFDGAESTVEIHRVGVGGEMGRQALYVLLLALGDLIDPCG